MKVGVKKQNQTFHVQHSERQPFNKILELTQFAIAQALLLHLALEGPNLLEPSFLVLDVLSEALQLLLLRGLLLLSLLLLLQVAQPLLLDRQKRGGRGQRSET